MTSNYVMKVFGRWNRRQGWRTIGNTVCNLHLIIPLIIVLILQLVFEKLAELFEWVVRFLERRAHSFQPFKLGKHRTVAMRQMRPIYHKLKRRE